MRAREAAWLSALATPSYPAHRERQEPDCGLRTPFQRDRDRIVHCKAFRRLKHKTQVFVAPEGDHFRDAAHAHARGHSGASGHRGEGAAAQRGPHGGDRPRARRRPPALRPHRRGRARPCRARALRPWIPPQRALAAGRLGARERSTSRSRFATGSSGTPQEPVIPRTLEGKIVRLVDRIAYINHDIDDALRAPASSAPEDLPVEEIAILGPTGQRPHRCPGARPRRALRAGRGHRAGRDGGSRDAVAALVHVRPRLPRAGGAGRAREDRARPDDAVRLLLHARVAGGAAGTWSTPTA